MKARLVVALALVASMSGRAAGKLTGALRETLLRSVDQLGRQGANLCPPAVVRRQPDQPAQHEGGRLLVTGSVQEGGCEPLERRRDLELIRNLVHQHTRSLALYRCDSCGFKARHFYWHCPACHGWETYPPRRSEERELAA